MSLEHLGRVFDNSAAQLLGETLDEAIAEFLDSNRSPSRRVNEIDNRGVIIWRNSGRAVADRTRT